MNRQRQVDHMDEKRRPPFGIVGAVIAVLVCTPMVVLAVWTFAAVLSWGSPSLAALICPVIGGFFVFCFLAAAVYSLAVHMGLLGRRGPK